jgi:hypothetical protein
MQMPFVPIPDTVKVEILGQDTSTLKDVVNVMHVETSSPGDGAQQTSIGNLFHTWLSSIASEVLATQYVGSTITVTDISVADGTQTVIDASDITGSAGTSNAAGNCALAKLTTGLTGRSNRGRTFVGPIQSAAMLGGVLTSGARSAITSAYTTLMDGLVALGDPAALCIASKVLGASEPVTTVVCELLPAYQRRRGAR